MWQCLRCRPSAPVQASKQVTIGVVRPQVPSPAAAAPPATPTTGGTVALAAVAPCDPASLGGGAAQFGAAAQLPIAPAPQLAHGGMVMPVAVDATGRDMHAQPPVASAVSAGVATSTPEALATRTAVPTATTTTTTGLRTEVEPRPPVIVRPTKPHVHQ